MSRWLLLALLWGAGAVGAQPAVVDDLGRQVRLAAPAWRVISLAPHLTEVMFALEAGDRVVGAMDGSDWPPQAEAIPRVGGHRGLDLEVILALQPDLVLAWSSGNPRGQVDKLIGLGLPVFFSEPRRLEDIPRTLERLGRLLERTETGREAAARFRARLATLRERHEDLTPVTVFYQVWNRPLVTLNGQHLVSQLLRLCGGRNIFADLPALAPQISLEAVLVRDPQAIVASGAGDERPAWLDDWRRWPQLTAVAHDNLFAVHPDLVQRPGPRVLRGAARLCEVLRAARGRLFK